MKLCECKGRFIDIIINNNRYLKCENCGYIKKVDIKSLEEQKDRYDFHVCDDGYYKYMNNVYENIVNHLNCGLSLDFGCGKVHALADILNDNGYECKYYDLFYYPKFPDFLYDNIIMIEVFEHLENPLDELLKLKKFLNKNGRIVIMTKPYPDDLNNWWYLRDITHVSFIKEETLKKWANILKMDLYFDEDIFVFKCI